MAIKSFKDLLVWQKSRELMLDVYRAFKTCRDYGFKDQIQRASVSISNNIAEGYGRRNDKYLAQFLTIARGSLAELESMVLAAFSLGYLSDLAEQKVLADIDEVARLLTALEKKVRA